MEESLYDYMKRQSTQVLDSILDHVVHNYTYAPEDVVRTVLAVLAEREKELSLEITPQMCKEFSQYMEERIRKQDIKAP